MARPPKEGLTYFPLDTDIDQDEKIVVVVAKHGMKGFGIIIRLMMEVYKNGYFYRWTEKEQHVFSMKIAEPVEYVVEVVQECLKWGFFHQELHKKYGILTSKGFQKRYLLAVNRRKDVNIKPEYDLIIDVSANNNLENANNNPARDELLHAETQQKKRKESKRNNNTRKQVYEEDSVYFKLANRLYQNILKNNPQHKKPNLQKWADDIRLMMEIDKRSEKQIAYLMDWVQKDSFEMTNVLSPDKLRKRFDQLAMKVKASQKPKQQPEIRDKKIEFQKYLEGGGNPDEFDWS